MEPFKDLTAYNFVSDLIFHPEHARPEDRTTSLTISILTGIFSLGLFPLAVGTAWGIHKVVSDSKGDDAGTTAKVSDKVLRDSLILQSYNAGSVSDQVEEMRDNEVVGITSGADAGQVLEIQEEERVEVSESEAIVGESDQVPVNSEFEVEYRRDLDGNITIILLAKDPVFLKQKLESISHYTRKADPNFELKDFKIDEIPSNSEPSSFNAKKLSKGFTHYGVLDDILPRPIKVLYGDHRVNTSQGNCHGAALVAAGIFPAMTNLGSTPTALDIAAVKTDRVALNQLANGDLVTLYGGLGDHSFVFIDHDISLSMNGQGANLELQRTADILKLYRFRENSLNPASSEVSFSSERANRLKSGESIVILRKHEDWSYPEVVIPELIEFYRIYNNSLRSSFPGDRNFHLLEPIATKIKNFAEEPQDDPRVQEAWQLLHQKVVGNMHSTIQNRNQLNNEGD